MTLKTNMIGQPKKIQNEIRQAIQLYREKNFLSRDQISKEIGIGHSTYYNAIQHNERVRPLQYDKIPNYYNNVVLNKKNNKKAKVEIEKTTQIIAKGAIKITKSKDEIVIEIK